MSLQNILISASQSVLLEQMRPTRKVHLQPREFIPPSLPPPPLTISQSSTWPACFQDSIDNALQKVWKESTVKMYSHSIKTFLAFCEKHGIPPQQIFPASEYLLCAFIASQKDSVAASTIKNYMSGIRAWHIKNGFSFTRSDRLNLLVHSSRPLANKRPLRPPVSLDMLLTLADKLEINDPFDACVLACATTAFWGLARLGELLPISYNFDHNLPPFPSPTNISNGQLDSIKIFLPWTKVKHWSGETIYLTVQNNKADPVAALRRHLAINCVSKKALLFSFQDDYGTSILLKQHFMDRCNEIWSASNLATTTGHSFRIGGTSHLLLCGVNPDIIKQTGRWSSDSFLRYWRNLDTVIPTHTSNIKHTSAAGPSGEPRPSLGCGPPPSGLAPSDFDSPSAGPSKDGAVPLPIGSNK